MDAAQGPINLKSNKPDSFARSHDLLVLNKWLSKVEQYLMLVQLSVYGIGITEANQNMYASKFLTCSTMVWWYI